MTDLSFKFREKVGAFRLRRATKHAEEATSRKDWPEAVLRWRAVIDNYGAAAPARAYDALSHAYRSQGDLAAADAAIDQGRSAYPGHARWEQGEAEQAVARKDWASAIVHWKAAIDGYGKRVPASAYVGLARALQYRGDNRAAEAMIEQGRRRHPGDRGLMIEFAKLVEQRKDWREAISILQGLVKELGKNAPPRIFLSLSRLHRRKGDLGSASAVIAQGLAIHPSDTRIAIEQGEIAAAQGNWDESAAQMKQLLERRGDADTPAGVFRNLSRAKYHQGKYEEAADLIERGLLVHPDDKGLMSEQGRFGAKREDTPAVARAAVRAIQRVPTAHPLVSIIVLTRDGMSPLDAMFRSFLAANTYPKVEFIIVDHASTDRTAEMLERWAGLLTIRVMAYDTNNTFSFSNNRAAEAAKGSLLLLLNNDIFFSEDVIGRMVATFEDPGIGATGVKQYLGNPASALSNQPYHIGTRFAWNEKGRFLRPHNVEPSPTDGLLTTEPSIFPAVTGSALMCRRDEYLSLGGLSEAYSYGFEDVDFCCKIRFILEKEIVCINDTFIYHDESATRRKDSKSEVNERKSGNTETLKRRFGAILSREYRRKTVSDDGSYSGRPFTVGIAVTSTDTAHGAGDLYTAMGLGRALRKRHNWVVHYFAAPYCYDVRDIDLFIAMRDDLDLGNLVNASPHLIKVAWLRNWFDRWAERPWLPSFEMLLCSSVEGANFVSARTGLNCALLPIAVAPDIFSLGPSLPEFESDCVFTGSHWNAVVPREIEAFDPSTRPHTYAVYGKNWETHPTLASSHRGFAAYAELPRIYNSAKITIDDTAHHAKPWGSVNSRVFEALAAGSLVLTNNAIGSQALFGGRLLVWNSVEELTQLIDLYLANPDKRDALVSALRQQVLAEHTYDHRADAFAGLLDQQVRRLRIAIKCPVPRAWEAEFWGDYHLAKSLAKALRKFGHQVRIDFLPDWMNGQSLADDVAIVFRGLSAYVPSCDQVNLCWLISHPDKVRDEELEEYDHVFVASTTYAEKLGARLSTPVTALLQCSDPDIFHPPENPRPDVGDLLFVGNSRMHRRRIVDDALAEGLPIAVYGREWEGLIDASVVRGERIDNEELGSYYGSAKIVLNDHWPDMAKNGFVSNRLFDVALSGGFVISDQFAGSEIFGDALVTYDTAPRLRELYEGWMADDQRRAEAAARLRDIVLAGHTIDQRAAVLNEAIERLAAGRMAPPVDEPLRARP